MSPTKMMQSAARHPMEDRIKSLFEVGHLLISQASLDQILLDLLNNVQKVMSCEASSLLLRIPGSDAFEFVQATGSAASKVRTKKIILGEGISGEVARIRKPINVPNAYQDSRFNDTFDKLTGFVTRQVLAVPMLFEERLIGVLSIFNTKTNLPFDAQDETFLSIFCSQASIAYTQALEKKIIASNLTHLSNIANEICSIMSTELTLFSGAKYRVERELTNHLGTEEHSNLNSILSQQFEQMEASIEGLGAISQAMSLFTRATTQKQLDRFSLENLISYCIRNTRFFQIHRLVKGSMSVEISGWQEGIFSVLETLFQIAHSVDFVSNRYDTFGAVNPFYLAVRERSDSVDILICCEDEFGRELRENGKFRNKLFESGLLMSTVNSLVGVLGIEFLDFPRLVEQNRVTLLASDFELQNNEFASKNSVLETDRELFVLWQMTFNCLKNGQLVQNEPL